MSNNKIINSYKLFFRMISKDLAQFFLLAFFLIFFETIILISSVVTALPLIEYIVDPSFKNASQISLYLEKF